MSSAEARRLAITTQGLGAERDGRAVSPRMIRNAIRHIGFLQIDSVNVLVRAHYMPLFSRLGAYDMGLIHDEAYRGRTRTLAEYWVHEASLVPVESMPLFRWRMEDAARGSGIYEGLARFARENAPLVKQVLGVVRDRGAIAASGIGVGEKKGPGWWNWSEAKTAIEFLFWTGEVTVARRETAGFTRIYDLPERVLPEAVHAAPVPSREEAQRALLGHAARRLGIATEIDLREYFRLPVADTKARLADLIEAGEVTPVEVEGWNKPAFLAKDMRVPREVEGAALLSPFDPLVCERPRTERLFDFHYRIEIYTPAHKRQFGYYCLPFLMGDRIVARVDLKADRAAGVLRVESAHLEGHARAADVAGPLKAELDRMAGWLGLETVSKLRFAR